MKHVTIKDVAKRLNCSVSTVSRAFNDKYDIRKDTQEMILTAAKEMGYSPNPIAKSLLKQCSNQIGVVVPEFINSFFPEVIIGIQEVFIKKGYQVLIQQSGESHVTELENVKTLENNMVDGMIISLSLETKNVDYYKELIKRGFPLVFFNRVSNELDTSKVLIDDYKWAFFATEHLIYQGFKKIFHFAGPEELMLSQNRKNGFIDAHRKHKLPFTENNIIETGLMIWDGERVMEKLINENNIPEAIFAVNDPTAIGAMQMLKKHGYKIPEDVALVGFTESKLAELIEPPLTSVAQPTLEIGRTAAKLLLEQIESKGIFVPQTVILNGRLNVRESSMKLK
ncbi:MAG: LacI family DNA-binding transcriptional regulator [Bacteroidota bacterium]|nr:LacI family DNA-binding transcriptional regulator [Bacteroidota bacterium]MDP4225327.1 LacI family DNA-binding transcriptional regulator [Bacteroidota bacterium]MDP4273026.1 LacI family DNA-binding transcriptional regulator [Bacteroidota bacterium]